MNRISVLIVIVAIVLCNNSCTKSEPSGELAKNTPNKFTVSKAVSDFSDTDFVNGDRVGLYIVARTSVEVAGVLAGSGNLFDNILFTFNSGAMTAPTEQSYPEGVSHVDIYGYAPYSSAGIDAQSQLAFSVAADQSASLSSSDLLWVKSASVSTTASTAPKLIFSHRLSKIVVRLTAGAGVTLTSPTVTVNSVLPTVVLNMADGTLTAAQGAATSIKAHNIPLTTDFHAIIAPQSITALENFITLTNGDKSYKYNLIAAKQFSSGKVYTFDLIVNINDLTVKIDGSVDNWQEGDTTSGEAI